MTVVDDAAVQLLHERAKLLGPVVLAGEAERLLTGTVITRSTTSTAARPDSAARFCSHARFRQVAEHHLGIGPWARGVIGPSHHPQVVAAARRALPFVGLAAGSRTGERPCRAAARSCCWRR